eukprot:TRINITY_DN3953_c5_g1_i1.p1 TRINITY_DN3953_c5_g1~~TRINITY_DN3953_c5_g1_i1.p1  ORF type:complete len:205 (+),score=34.41 TRINITY_DN3953_c5_g1_i1:99-713(+)
MEIRVVDGNSGREFCIALERDDSLARFKDKVAEEASMDQEMFSLEEEGNLMMTNDSIFGLGVGSTVEIVPSPRLTAIAYIKSKFKAVTDAGMRSAVIYNDHELVKKYITAGVDVNGKSRAGRTALHIAAGFGDVSMCRYLIQEGADPTQKSTEGKTALDYVSHSYRAEDQFASAIRDHENPTNTEIQKMLLEAAKVIDIKKHDR